MLVRQHQVEEASRRAATMIKGGSRDVLEGPSESLLASPARPGSLLSRRGGAGGGGMATPAQRANVEARRSNPFLL